MRLADTNQHKNCEECGQSFARKMYIYEGKKHLEDLKLWNGRQFCSTICANNRQRSKRAFKPRTKYATFNFQEVEPVFLIKGIGNHL